MPATTTERPITLPLWRRLLWFAALWLGGVAALGVVAYGLRALVKILG